MFLFLPEDIFHFFLKIYFCLCLKTCFFFLEDIFVHSLRHAFVYSLRHVFVYSRRLVFGYSLWHAFIRSWKYVFVLFLKACYCFCSKQVLEVVKHIFVIAFSWVLLIVCCWREYLKSCRWIHVFLCFCFTGCSWGHMIFVVPEDMLLRFREYMMFAARGSLFQQTFSTWIHSFLCS